MDNTTYFVHIIEEKQNFDYLPLIILVAIFSYFLLVIGFFLTVYVQCAWRLKQKSPEVSLRPYFPSFLDCSSINICLPCNACSPRNFLRMICPTKEMFRRVAACECCMPTGQIVVPGLDLVCCKV